MSNQLRVNIDPSEQQNLMTGRLILAARPKPRTIKKLSRRELAVVPQERNWKGLFLSVIVIGIVCGLVGLSAWLLQPPETGRDYLYSYDFNAMFAARWRPFSSRGKWVGDSLFYQDEYMNIMRRANGVSEIFISNETVESLGMYEYSVSPDQKYILVAYEVVKVFRYSKTAKYFIYSVETRAHTSLHPDALQYAEWGTKGSQMTYVFHSDLFYKSSVLMPPVQVTYSGENSSGNILNGIADWVYEEEMFQGTAAHWLSNDGSNLAYVSFNDTLVREVDIVLYNMPYPEVEKIKYPKAGYNNPRVALYIYNIATGRQVKLTPPDSLEKTKVLLNSVVWVSDETMLASWSNRYQNVSITMLCAASFSDGHSSRDLTCRKTHEQRADGWIEYVGELPVPGSDGVYFQIEEKQMGAKGKFHHLLLVDYSSNPSKTKFLTNGNWEVTKVLGYNKETGKVYFISNAESPGDRHLYSLEVKKEMPTPVCLTCDGSCSYVKADLAPSEPLAYVTCMGPDVPSCSALNLQTLEKTVFEDNAELKFKMNNAKMPEIVYDSVAIEGENGNYDLSAKLYLPPNRDKKKKYPLIVNLYSGPGSQEVDSRFSLDWKTYVTTNLEMAVMLFDGRGSGYRGSHILKEVNRRLGHFEIEDQITAIRQILAKHPYLDETKIGIWGWSYGGYAAAMVASHPQSLSTNLTKCAISVAPVTDWTLYDSIYTERYMGSPENNIKRYIESSLLTRSDAFRYFKYLLVHGTRDDNVHFQNSAVLETALVRAGIVHRYQVYTDEIHSLSSDPSVTLRHLYRLMTSFWRECFEET